jgi:hypothetical protein
MPSFNSQFNAPDSGMDILLLNPTAHRRACIDKTPLIDPRNVDVILPMQYILYSDALLIEKG